MADNHSCKWVFYFYFDVAYTTEKRWNRCDRRGQKAKGLYSDPSPQLKKTKLIYKTWFSNIHINKMKVRDTKWTEELSINQKAKVIKRREKYIKGNKNQTWWNNRDGNFLKNFSHSWYSIFVHNKTWTLDMSGFTKRKVKTADPSSYWYYETFRCSVLIFSTQSIKSFITTLNIQCFS